MTVKRGARAASPDQSEQAAAAASGVPIPQFLQPQPQRQDSADPELTTLHPQESPQETRGDHPQDAGDFSAGADDEPGPMAVSTPASTKAPRLRPLATAAQVATAKSIVTAGLMGASALANRRARQHQDDPRWLMNPDELDAIGSPFARILARRTPIPGDGEDASDIADMVEGVVGLLAYAMRQLFAEPVPAPAYVREHQGDEEPPAPAGPGATVNPLDPAYRVG